jgi:hypothetical protein
MQTTMKLFDMGCRLGKPARLFFTCKCRVASIRSGGVLCNSAPGIPVTHHTSFYPTQSIKLYPHKSNSVNFGSGGAIYAGEVGIEDTRQEQDRSRHFEEIAN